MPLMQGHRDECSHMPWHRLNAPDCDLDKNGRGKTRAQAATFSKVRLRRVWRLLWHLEAGTAPSLRDGVGRDTHTWRVPALMP